MMSHCPYFAHPRNMRSSSPLSSPKVPLASTLVCSERKVDWSRRRSSIASISSTSADAENGGGKSISFAPTIKQRPIPGLLDMTREEIASVWRTPFDRSQCTSHIADTVRIVRCLKRDRHQKGICGTLQEDQYCERGIEVYIDEKYKQRIMHQRKLLVVSVLSKQEELRQRNFDPTKNCSHEKELANLATTINRESVKSARIRAKKDLMAARELYLSRQVANSPSPASSATSSSSNETRFGGMAAAARSLSWNRRNALSALKRNSSHRHRERQQFIGQARRSSVTHGSISDDDSVISGSSHDPGNTGRRCRTAKMA